MGLDPISLGLAVGGEVLSAVTSGDARGEAEKQLAKNKNDQNALIAKQKQDEIDLKNKVAKRNAQKTAEDALIGGKAGLGGGNLLTTPAGIPMAPGGFKTLLGQ